MTAIIKNGSKWEVRDTLGEWEFDTYQEAQAKANWCTAEQIKRLTKKA